MRKTNPLNRSPSPVLSDGGTSKRPASDYEMRQEFNKNEKFQKVRRLDSPTPQSPPNLVQIPSPQSKDTMTSKASKVAKELHRSTSPKQVYPAPIQKFLNGRNNITMEQAVEKLKTPSKKMFQKSLEAMKLVTSLQQAELESNIGFRKAYTNSTTSVSPAHSGSPAGSPRPLYSPKTGQANKYPGDNIIMTYDDDDQMISSPSQAIKSEMVYDNIDTSSEAYRRLNERMMNNPALKGIKFDGQSMTQAQGSIFNSMQFQAQNGQSGAMNFLNQGDSQQGQFGNQFGFAGNNMFSGGNNSLVNQQLIFNAAFQNNNGRNSQGSVSVEEVRDRTSSFLVGEENDTRDRASSFFVRDMGGSGDKNSLFLQNLGLPTSQRNSVDKQSDFQSLATNQVNAIQNLMSKRTTSVTEPAQGLNYFQKRNSNPENKMNNHNQFQFQQQNQQSFFQGNQNTGNHFNGMQDHYGHQDYQQNYNSQAQQQGIMNAFGNGMFGNGGQHNDFSNGQLNGQRMDMFQMAANSMNHGEKIEYNSIHNEEGNWLFQNAGPKPQDGGVLDPENFFSTEKNSMDHDFAMNIVPSDPNFMGRKDSDLIGNSLEEHIMNMRANWD